MNKANTNNRPQVTVIKEFDVTPEKVFDAWLNPEMLGKWMFGPEVRDEEIIKLETNPKKGGRYSFVVRRDDDIINHLGKYLEVDRPHRLVFTWGIESESEDESVVTVEIETTGKGCQLSLTHELDPKWADYADRTEEGWRFMLGELKEILT